MNGIESDWIWLNIKPSNDITINFDALSDGFWLIGDAVAENMSLMNNNAHMLNSMHFIDAIAKQV